jgi:DNA polymerase-3 subunit gamma/tau
MKQLYEKYRPRTWDEVIGQDKAVRQIGQLRKRGLAGRAYWVSGQSGTGKTTIARLLASEVADDMYVEELDATDLTPAGLRRIESSMQLYSLGKGGRAYIVNEAHGLSKPSVRQLLVLLERLPSHVVVIFTTTTEGQLSFFEDKMDAGPLLSRCLRLDLARRGLAQPFAERAREIADKEGLNGRPIEQYVRLCKENRNNFRAVLQAIETGAMCKD